MIFVLELPRYLGITRYRFNCIGLCSYRQQSDFWIKYQTGSSVKQYIRNMLEMFLHVIFTVRTVYSSDPFGFQKTMHVLEMHDGIKTTQLVVYRFMVISPLCKTTQNHFNNLISLTFLAWNKPILRIFKGKGCAKTTSRINNSGWTLASLTLLDSHPSDKLSRSVRFFSVLKFDILNIQSSTLHNTKKKHFPMGWNRKDKPLKGWWCFLIFTSFWYFKLQ